MADFFESSLAVVERPDRRSDGESSFWRKSPPQFDSDGQLTIGGMFQHQEAWWNLPNFIKLLVGGFGAGKTNILSKRVIANALTNAPCPVGVVSPTYNVARQTTLSTMADNAAGKRSIYGPKFWWQYNQSSHEFLIRYKGRLAKIIQYSGDNPLSLRGPNLASAFIDEPFIQDEEVFHQLVARVRHPNAKLVELGMSGTPEQLNWGYDLVEGELSERHDVGYIRAATQANLSLSKDYVKRLYASFTDKAAAAYIGGEFENLATGAVYYGFDPSENIVQLNKPPGAELGVGMDFNVDPMAACVFWRNKDHMHVIEEIELPNADTEFMCDELREKYGDELREVYPDASGKQRRSSAPGGKSDFYYIREAGLQVNCHESNPHRRDRYNAVNTKLKPGRKRRIQLTIDPSCKKLKKFLQLYTHEGMNKPAQKKMSHLLDALGYAVSYLWPVDKDTVRVAKLRGA